jgi:hypothetical protein
MGSISRLISCGEAERHNIVKQEGARVHAWAKGAERAELGAGEGESKGTQKGREGEDRYLWSSRKAARLGSARLPQLSGC